MTSILIEGQITEAPEGTLSHSVIVEAITIAYPKSGPHAGYAMIHAQGCNHTKRDAGRGNESIDRTMTLPYADDYFEVAPCARRRGAKRGE